MGPAAGSGLCVRAGGCECEWRAGGGRAPPGAGSAGINQTENYTHSSAELAKEKYICHIALKPGEVVVGRGQGKWEC